MMAIIFSVYEDIPGSVDVLDCESGSNIIYLLNYAETIIS